MTRKVTLTIHNDQHTFKEDYVEGTRGSFTEKDDNLLVWATALVARYNASRHPGERERFLDGVEESDTAEKVKREHDWHKTNLVTLCERGQYFDRLKCEVCGITAKRFGLANIRIDYQYRAKKYQWCTPRDN